MYPFVKLRQKTTEPVTWSLCRDQQPSPVDIHNTPLTADNWGAKWEVHANVCSTIVPDKPNAVFSIGWYGRGTGAPNIRVTSPNHTSPWHTHTGRMGLPFIERLLDAHSVKKRWSLE